MVNGDHYLGFKLIQDLHVVIHEACYVFAGSFSKTAGPWLHPPSTCRVPHSFLSHYINGAMSVCKKI